MAGVSRDIPRVEAEFGLPLTDLLLDLYVNKGLSTRKIGEWLRVSSVTVGKWCRQRRVPMRQFRGPQIISNETFDELYRRYAAGESGESLINQTGYSYSTIVKAVRKNGGQVRTGYDAVVRKYDLAHDYFKQIDTPLKAYFLGFLAADGSLIDNSAKRGGKCIRLTIQERDREIVEALRDEVGPTVPVRRTSTTYRGKELWYVDIQLNSARMFGYLESHGLHPRKTWSLKPPVTVPREFLHDFVRGFFDGDGGVAVTKGIPPIQTYFCGTPEMMTWLTEVFRDECGVPPNKVCLRTERFATLAYSCSKAVAIRDYMYPTGTEFGLSRKKAKLFSVAPKGVVAEAYLQRAFG